LGHSKLKGKKYFLLRALKLQTQYKNKKQTKNKKLTTD
jgi:hypothetical protein